MNCIFKPHFGESLWVRFGMEVLVEFESGNWVAVGKKKKDFRETL